MIPSSISTIKLAMPSVKNFSTSTVFVIKTMKNENFFNKFGRTVIKNPSNVTAKKSITLPKNPFVLLVIIFPCFLATPVLEADSNSSSLCFLLTFSRLLSKNLPSSLINLLLNKFVSFV